MDPEERDYTKTSTEMDQKEYITQGVCSSCRPRAEKTIIQKRTAITFLRNVKYKFNLGLQWGLKVISVFCSVTISGFLSGLICYYSIANWILCD